MSELSYTKGEEQCLFKSPRLLGQWMDTQGGGGKKKGLVWGSGSGHTSQEVTPAMLDYKQCALSTSAVLTVEHTTSATAKGVALVEGRTDGFSPLSPTLFNAASIQ